MPFYVGDYIRDTQHLTTEQHGAYLLLIFAMFSAGGSLPNDEAKLSRIARMTKAKWLSNRDDILPFFQIDGDALTHSKITEVRKKYEEKLHKLAQNGSKGGTAKALKNQEMGLANAVANGLAKSCQPEPEPIKEDKQSKTDELPPAEKPYESAFKQAVAAQSKLGRSRLKKATAWSLWQRLSKQHGEDRLLAAYLRYLATDADAKRDGGAYQSGLQVWLKEKSDQWLEQGVRRSRPVDVDTIRAMIKTRDATPSFAWPEDRLGMTESEARKMIV
jgi:uncharacterized protein YdaU (DUF1376 family)